MKDPEVFALPNSITHTVLLGAATCAAIAVVCALVCVSWLVSTCVVARRSSEAERAAYLRRKCSRGGTTWLRLPSYRCPNEVEALYRLAAENGYRLVGFERSRGPLRTPLAVLLAVDGAADIILRSDAQRR